MSKVISLGYPAPIVEPETATVHLPQLATYHTLPAMVSGETTVTNLSASVDQPATIRFGVRNRPNIYAGMSNIERTSYLPTTSGSDIVVQLRELWIETDSTLTDYRKAIPVVGTITLSIPDYGNVTDDAVMAFATRVFGALVVSDGGAAVGTDQVRNLRRGITDPIGL